MDAIQSVWYRLALLFVAMDAIVCWFIFGPSSPWSAVAVASGTFALGPAVAGPVVRHVPRQWFRVLASSYFRSQVLDDVYEQTEDARDRNGGYLITVLRSAGSRR